MDKISVIIPVYNGVRYLNECLHSVFCGTYRNLEVIVVNDGSSDDVYAAAGEYETDIELIKTDHKGQSAARNLGFKYASGGFISFFDSDDINGKMHYEMCVKRFEKNPDVGMVFCGTTFINADGGFFPGIGRFPDFSANTFLGKMFEHNRIPTISVAIIRADIVRKLGGFDESFPIAEDFDFFLRLGKIAKVDYIDLPLVRYRKHQNNLCLDTKLYNEYFLKAVKKHDPAEIASYLSRIYKKEEEFRIAFGKLLYRTGFMKQALQQFVKAQEINKFSDDACFFAGNCHFSLENYKKAGDEYCKCLVLNPGHSGCLNNSAVLHYYLGDYKLSKSELQRAAEYNSNCLEVQHNLNCIQTHRQKKNQELLIVNFVQQSTEMDFQVNFAASSAS